MKNFTKRTSGALALALSSLFATQADGQCTITNSLGKSVTISVTPVSIIAPTSCAGGYGYQVSVNYTVTIGSGATFYGADGSFTCDADAATGFYIPSVGTGNLTSYGTWTSKTNCATATPSNMLCGSLALRANIGGELVTANCAFVSRAPLPVKLTSFDAAINNDKVALTWTTTAEAANAYFILERSNDAKEWNAITKMNGSGADRINNTYNYTDDMPQSGRNYYRLKQGDVNGGVAYSRILAVDAADAGKTIAIYPNPNNGDHLHFIGLQTAADWSMKVLNTTSTIVYQTTGLSENLSLPNLPSGMYYVQLHNSKTGKTEMVKLMKN